jgi:hypothetical protein
VSPFESVTSPPKVVQDYYTLSLPSVPSLRIDEIVVPSKALSLTRSQFENILRCLEAFAQSGFELVNPVTAIPIEPGGVRYSAFTHLGDVSRQLRSDCGTFDIIPSIAKQGRATVARGVVSFGNGLTHAGGGSFIERKTLLLGQIEGATPAREQLEAAAARLIEEFGFRIRRWEADATAVLFSALLDLEWAHYDG